jgi:hypothetical protein
LEWERKHGAEIERRQQQLREIQTEIHGREGELAAEQIYNYLESLFGFSSSKKVIKLLFYLRVFIDLFNFFFV